MTGEPYNPNKKMLSALAVVVPIEMLSTLYDHYIDGKFGEAETTAAIVMTLPFCALVIYLINTMCNGVSSSGKPREFGAWSFIWRYLVVSGAALILASLVLHAFNHSAELMRPSVELTITGSLIAALLVPFIVWVLFSKDRKYQLHQLNRFIGGG